MVFSSDWKKRTDFPLLQNGAVNLFYRKSVFEGVIADLEKLDYRIVKIVYTDMAAFREELSSKLEWKKRFGYHPWTGNLDALNDGLCPGELENGGKTAICIEDFDRLYQEDDKLGFALLDMIESNSRQWLLFGERLIALIQTNDRDFQCEGVGSNSAHWNQKEASVK